MLSLSCLIDVSMLFSMLASPLPSSLDTYSLSISSLGCKALCIVLSFLVFVSICWNSSLVHFKNGPKYLTRRTAQLFILFIRFLPYSFVSSSFLILLRYFKKFFLFHLCLFDGVCLQYSLIFVIFFFSERSDFFLIC